MKCGDRSCGEVNLVHLFHVSFVAHDKVDHVIVKVLVSVFFWLCALYIRDVLHYTRRIVSIRRDQRCISGKLCDLEK